MGAPEGLPAGCQIAPIFEPLGDLGQAETLLTMLHNAVVEEVLVTGVRTEPQTWRDDLDLKTEKKLSVWEGSKDPLLEIIPP